MNHKKTGFLKNQSTKNQVRTPVFLVYSLTEKLNYKNLGFFRKGFKVRKEL